MINTGAGGGGSTTGGATVTTGGLLTHALNTKAMTGQSSWGFK
jgi:hypothetical protein